MQDEASAKLSANERLAADFAEALQHSEGLETRLAAAESLLDAGTVRVSELQVRTPGPGTNVVWMATTPLESCMVDD